MKKILLSFMNVMMICMMAFFASCSKDDDVADTTPVIDPVVTQPTTYTVMLYGCGGSNLDKMLAYNLDQIAGLGKQSRINFTALVKYSKPYQTKTDCEGTRLLTLTKDGMQNEKKYDANYRLDNPEHLANFIKESKEKMPADKYILVFWDHGNTFGPDDKPVQSSYPEGTTKSRAALADDNTGKAMSTYEIEKGIKDSGTKLDLVYFDVCLMGMVETYYQLKDCSKYIMAASHNTPGLGGNYTKLFTELEEKDSLSDAIKAYVPAAVTNWKNMGETVADLSCFDTQYMDEFVQNVKAATTEVLKLKKENTEISKEDENDEAKWNARRRWFGQTQFGANCGGIIYPFYIECASVDLYSLLTRLAANCVDGTLSSYATLIRNLLEKMTVASASFGLPQWMDRVSMGVTWPTDVFIADAKKYEKPLRSSAFCQATGWDKILFDTDNPQMSYVASAFFENYFYYYEDVQTSYAYAWDVTLSVDESKVKPIDSVFVEDIVDEINSMAVKKLATKKYPLRFSKDLTTDLYTYVYYNYQGELTRRGANKITIKAELRPEQTVDPYDPDAETYDTSVVKEFDLSKDEGE